MLSRFWLCAFVFLALGPAWAAEDQSSAWERAIHEGRQYQGEGQYPKALEKFLDALQQADTCKSSRECVALTLSDLASVYSNLGSYSKTREYSRRSLKIFEQGGMKAHPGFAASLNNLAMAEIEMGHLRVAERLLRQSTDVRITTFGAVHPHVATSLMNLAGLYVRMGRFPQAETLYERALKIWGNVPESHQSDIARCSNNLASLYRSQKRMAEAIPLLQRSLAIWESASGEGHLLWANGAANLAALLCETREFVPAESLLLRAIKVLEESIPPNPADLSWMLSNYVYLLRQSGRPIEAQRLEDYVRGRKQASTSSPHDKVVDLSELLTFQRK